MQVAIGAAVGTPDDVEYVVEAERAGVTCVWVPEAWGQDALTPLAYLAARTSVIKLGTGIAQLGSRTPALLAMSAMSMQLLSRGRFLLGIGASGPQVMEGWHGVPFRSPVTTARETIAIVRRVARGDRLSHEGDVYRLPLPGGRGRALRSSMSPVAVPIYVAALGPHNLEMTGELAEGWIGSVFMPEHAHAFLSHLEAGAARAQRRLSDLDLVVPVAVELTDDVEEAARRHARGYAFTFGAMGSKDTNFYLAAVERQGYGDDARAVQSLWLAGKRDEAADRVPIELGLRTNLLGTPAMVKERLRLYRDAGVTTLQAKLDGDLRHRIETAATLVALVDEVNRETHA
jgi:F420-dependent oxidoreductase-like protein